MEDPTAQTIEGYMHDLAYDDIVDRIKNEFWDKLSEEAFKSAEDHLTTAYIQWAHHQNALVALTHLQNASVICNQRLQPAYLSKYNESVSYLTAETSRAGTPVHGQNAHMRNLLLRVTACLH